MREEIIFIWQRERKESDLVPIRDDFFPTVQRYLHHLETMAKEDENPTARKIFKKLYTRTNFLVNDLIDLRAQKIFSAALHDKNLALSAQEKKIFDSLQKSLLSHRRHLLGIEVQSPESISEEETPEMNEVVPSLDDVSLDTEVKYCTVEFLENELDVTLGPDLLSYGPFNKGDIAVIPVDNAQELERRNKIRIVDLNPKV